MNGQVLLTQIAGISNKYDLLYKKTGGYFNVFEIANIGNDELVICRVLYELLSPKGSHYQGNSYLKLFFKKVLDIEISEDELNSAEVFREYQIDQGRRIDLVIKTPERFIPIEVKIYADDQERQCYDYYEEAKKHTDNPKIFYLTRFGSDPGKESTYNLSVEDVVNISFSDDILNWLDLCLKHSNTIKIAPIREIILQFIGMIQKFTGKMGDEKEMEIKELLSSSSNNIKSAIAIKDTLNGVREEMIYKLLKAIEVGVGFKKLDNQYDYEYNNNQKINKFYNQKYSTYPGISYFYKSKDSINTDKDVWVRVEIANRIFIGYCCPVDGEATNKTLTVEEIKSILQVEPNISNWWAYWKYLPNGEKSKSPNFKEHNEPYYQLYDKDYFDQLTKICVNKVKEFLK